MVNERRAIKDYSVITLFDEGIEHISESIYFINGLNDSEYFNVINNNQDKKYSIKIKKIVNNLIKQNEELRKLYEDFLKFY